MSSTDQLSAPAPQAAFDSEAAWIWLSRLHGADEKGKFRHPIELRVLWLDRVAAPINRCFRDAKSLAEFASQYGSRDSGANLYTGVASRRDPNAPGDSSNLAEAPGAWVDIDAVAIGWDVKETLAMVRELHEQIPYALYPSAIVHSGRGLHLYWQFAEPLDLTIPGNQDRLVALTDRRTWAKELGVSTATLGRALTDLVEAGVVKISASKGRGTSVRLVSDATTVATRH